VSAVFTSASERSRAEPTVSATHPTVARIYGRAFEAGERYGYTRGWRYGVVCGVVLTSMLAAVAGFATGAV
jgi:hypothetical protein